MRALVLALAATLAGAAAAPSEPFSAPAEPQRGVRPSDLSAAETWAERLERDRRLSFTPRTAEAAREDLGASFLSPSQRAAALFAVGAAGAERERARLESWAAEGSLEERTGAVLGLGELGVRDDGLLARLAASGEPLLSGCALLALVRGGGESGRGRVAALARDPSHRLAASAAAVLDFQRDPTGAPEDPVLARYVDLRWDAARRYGLVAGQAWSTLLQDELFGEQRFLDEVVFVAASELPFPGVRDHFLEVLLEGGRPERLRGTLNAIPAEIERLYRTGLWAPADLAEWEVVVGAIDEFRLEHLTMSLLRQARAAPHLRQWASVLMVRAGNPEGLPLLELDLTADDPLVRAAVVQAVAGTGVRRFLPDLKRLSDEDPDPLVRASALVGLIRLGSATAKEEAERLLADPEHPRLPSLVEALVDARHAPEVVGLLTDFLPHAQDPVRVRVATAVLSLGRYGPRELLRELLASGERGPRAVEMVRALAVQPELEDLHLFRSLFPVEGDVAMNVELAIALVRSQDPTVVTGLRKVLWQGPWNRSVLAGALMVHLAGIQALHQELQRPPLGVGPRDFRRVGFALGEWGGLREVDVLAGRRRAADPALQGAVLGALSARTH